MIKKNFSKMMLMVGAAIMLLCMQACSSSDDEPLTDTQNPLCKKSFTYEFKSDEPYNRTYDLAFIDDNFFEFSCTAHGTTGDTFGKIVDTYSISDNTVTFDYAAKGFFVNNAYVRPVSALIVYESEVSDKIERVDLTLRFESRNGRISISTLEFFPSDYKPTTTIEQPKLKERDFKGSIWEIDNNKVFLYEDYTTSLIYDWSFQEKTQTIEFIDRATEDTKQYKIIEGNNQEFKCKNGSIWSKITLYDYAKGWMENYLYGEWINEDGETLEIDYSSIGGSLAPSLPSNTSRRKYEKQYLRFSGDEKGQYYIRYEGEEWDISKFIPWAWDNRNKGGAYEIKNIYSSRYSEELVLTGLFAGTYKRVQK